MILDELVEELKKWQRRGFGDVPVLLMNLNTQEYQEAEEVNPLSNTDTDSEQSTALEIR